MSINQINNGESGLSVRTTLNEVINKVNSSGVQLLSLSPINLNIPESVLTNPILSLLKDDSGGINPQLCYNATLTYSSDSGSFTIGEMISDGINKGYVFVDNAGTMSLYFPGNAPSSPIFQPGSMSLYFPGNAPSSPIFQPGSTITGQVSAATATIDTIVSNSIFIPGESIVGLNDFNASVVSFSSSSAYGVYSELSSTSGSPEITYISVESYYSPWIPGKTITDVTTGATASLVWIPGETITDVTTGATASLVWYNNTLSIINISGSFNDGDTISGSLSGNESTIGNLKSSLDANVFIGQTSKAIFSAVNYYTTQPSFQTLTLSGGSRFIVKDVVLTNGSGSYTVDPNSASSNIYTQPSLSSGELIFNIEGDTTNVLPGPNKVVGTIGGEAKSFLLGTVIEENTLHWNNVPFEAPSSADLYIYGYILD